MALFKQKIKRAKVSYTQQMLPQTRKQVFWDVLKLQWKAFLGYGFLFLLFTLPLHLVAVIEDSIVGEMIYNLNQQIGNMSQEDVVIAKQIIAETHTLFALFKLPGFLILGICLAGFSRVIRQHAWGENVFFRHDFVKGIKTNGVPIILLSILTGLFNVLIVYSYNNVGATQELGNMILWSLPLALFVLLVVPTFAYAVVSMSIYTNRFFTHLRLGFRMYFKRSWQTLLALVCCAIPFVLEMVPHWLFHIIGRFVGSMFALFVFLAWYLFALIGLDKFINQKQYPSIFQKGLFVDEQSQTDIANDGQDQTSGDQQTDQSLSEDQISANND